MPRSTRGSGQQSAQRPVRMGAATHACPFPPASAPVVLKAITETYRCTRRQRPKAGEISCSLQSLATHEGAPAPAPHCTEQEHQADNRTAVSAERAGRIPGPPLHHRRRRRSGRGGAGAS